MIGASGTVRGVTLFEGADAAPVPATFVAATVKLYAVPFASPVTVIGLPAPVAVRPSGFDVIKYEMIALPPSNVGGTKSPSPRRSPASPCR